MKGFMRQRGESWELRVFLGYDPVSGKQRYATRSVRGGKREAQRVLAEMVTEAERGLATRTTATVGELIEAWFEFATPDFSPKTVKETRGYIDRSLMPTLGARPLARLKPAALDAFYRKLQVSGGSGGRPLAPRNGATYPRHLATCARPGSQVGLDRRQPCSCDDATPCARVGNQTTGSSGLGAGVAPGRRGVA